MYQSTALCGGLSCRPIGAIYLLFYSFIHSLIYLLNNAIEKKKCSNMYSRSGQQGKGTDSCPEITELHKNYTTNRN